LLIGAHPEVEQGLHEELDGGSGAESPFLDQIIREVLRLVPPVGRMGRRPTHDIALDGVTLHSGEAVFVSPFVTQRDPRWFDDPDSFRPLRWTQEHRDRPHFAYFPFGGGPRSCIGEQLTKVVMAQVVTAIARDWRLRPTRAELPPLRSLLTLKPRGAVWMAAERRG
jgi:cytochrome P450